MVRFAGIEREFTAIESAEIVLQPIPFDGTSTWGKGADKGFKAFLEAAENMELYDIETDSEVYRKGIHTLPPLTDFQSPELVFYNTFSQTKKLLDTGKFLTFFGGEHSISIGIISAFRKKFQDLTVVQLDAHADLRKSYNGSEFNHACAMHQANRNTNLIQVGIRSMDSSEKQYMNRDKCFFAEDIINTSNWMDKAMELMTDNVYISIDLDVFDPSIMPATGTPEPGGLDWYTVLNFLKKIMQAKNVRGFDIVELAPIKNNKAPNFLAAKLYYKLLSYKFTYNEQ